MNKNQLTVQDLELVRQYHEKTLEMYTRHYGPERMSLSELEKEYGLTKQGIMYRFHALIGLVNQLRSQVAEGKIAS